MTLQQSTLTIFIASSLLLFQGCKVNNQTQNLSDWNTYQGNASHTGYVPLELSAENFTLNWTVQITTNPLNPLAVADGKVFASTNTYFGEQKLFTLDATTGNIIWQKEYTGFHSINSPAYKNGNVYITTGGHDDTYLWSYKATSGDLVYKSSFDNQWNRYYSPTPFKDSIYIAGGYYGGTYSFDGTSGVQNWFVTLNQYDKWTPAVNDKYVVAYTGEDSPELTVIDRVSGTTISNIADPNFEWTSWSMNFAPILGENDNVLAIQDERLISFDINKKSIIWEINNQFSGQPTLSNGLIYVIRNGAVEVRKEANGKKVGIWSPATENITGTMIMTNNLLFCHSSTTTYAVEVSSKKIVWQVNESGDLAIGKAGNLYISTQDGRVISYKLL